MLPMCAQSGSDDNASKLSKMSVWALQLHPFTVFLYRNVYLLIIEAVHAGYSGTFDDGPSVKPDKVLVLVAFDDDIVILGFTFIRALGTSVARAKHGGVDGREWHIVTYGQGSLVQMHRSGGTGYLVAINLHLDGPS